MATDDDDADDDDDDSRILRICCCRFSEGPTLKKSVKSKVHVRGAGRKKAGQRKEPSPAQYSTTSKNNAK